MFPACGMYLAHVPHSALPLVLVKLNSHSSGGRHMHLQSHGALGSFFANLCRELPKLSIQISQEKPFHQTATMHEA